MLHFKMFTISVAYTIAIISGLLSLFAFIEANYMTGIWLSLVCLFSIGMYKDILVTTLREERLRRFKEGEL